MITKIPAILAGAAVGLAAAASDIPRSQKVYPGDDGRLIYAADEQGNIIPDFSWCGYEGGGVRLPEVPVQLILEPVEGRADDTDRIQSAIDQLSGLPVDAAGFRGTLLLKKGVYRVAGILRISCDGVVLRGEGDSKDGTVLFASGRAGRELIKAGLNASVQDTAFASPSAKTVGGKPDYKENPRSRTEMKEEYVPVGSRTLSLRSTNGYKAGDPVVVMRRANDAWIHEIGMDAIPKRPDRPSETQNWKADQYQIGYFRQITAVRGDTIEIDAPMVCAIEKRWGGGEVFRFEDFRIQRVGVENLRIVSEFDPSVAENGHYSDEKKCGTAIQFDGIKNGWVRDVTGVHLDRLILLDRMAQGITVQDCAYLDPVSRVTGERRYAFNILGQQCLIQRCYAENARHAYVYGSRVPGPNAVLDCLAVQNLSSSEPHHRWSTGGLYDNFSGTLSIINRGWLGSGHGWTAGNFVAWNTEGELSVQQPPTAMNYAIGHVGAKKEGFIKTLPDGWWESHGVHVEPRSLYLAQMKDRLGDGAVAATTTVIQRQGTVFDELKKRYATGRSVSWGAGVPAEMEEYRDRDHAGGVVPAGH